MRRVLLLITVALVIAAMMVATALPAFAVREGGRAMENRSHGFTAIEDQYAGHEGKPFTYGGCVSGVAAAGGDVKAVTKTMAPLQSDPPPHSKGKGTEGKLLIGCRR